METTAEQIKRLEQELVALKEKERKEREEAKKKAKAEREEDLQKIKTALDEFNKKYNDTLCLGIRRNSDVGKDLFDSLFPWFGD
jgi:uncharacterized protein YdaU (DUF1376 family)